MKSYISPDIRTVEIGDVLARSYGFDIISGTEKDPDEQLANPAAFEEDEAPINKGIWEE